MAEQKKTKEEKERNPLLPTLSITNWVPPLDSISLIDQELMREPSFIPIKGPKNARR
jgi:hypothetical protein